MIKNKAVHALKRAYSPHDRVVFDANILVSIFSGLEPPMSVIVRSYSAALKQIRTSGATILLDVLVLSEFVNVCARKEYDLAHPPASGRPSFKMFRQSASFVPVAQAIARAAQQIAACSCAVDHAFSRWPLIDLLNDYSTGQHDVNDQCIVHLCQQEKALLLTNDRDFQSGGITVLTTNPKLLAACP